MIADNWPVSAGSGSDLVVLSFAKDVLENTAYLPWKPTFPSVLGVKHVIIKL